MTASLWDKVLRRVQTKRFSTISKLKRASVRRHLQKLSDARSRFHGYPDVLVAFETFNKGHVMDSVLAPFLRAGFQNIVLFADGCADETSAKAARKLLGEGHFVLNCNNLHEVKAYSIAEKIADWLDVEFILLCQDDDLYPDEFAWLDAALLLMRENPGVATVGFNGGYDFSSQISDSDESYATAHFESYQRDGRAVAGLKPYYELLAVKPAFNISGFGYNFSSAINRAPQIVRTSFLKEIGGWPRQYAPFNYDDLHLCLTAWQRNYSVVHMPLPTVRRDVGIGGTRLFGAMGVDKRPAHLGRNWHLFYSEFGAFINSGRLSAQVNDARLRGVSNL
jgi:hypothetical protein